jgi:hypothetical protein
LSSHAYVWMSIPVMLLFFFIDLEVRNGLARPPESR